VVLAGLKRYLGSQVAELTAIVTVTDDGSVVHGESALARQRAHVRRVFLDPATAWALPEVLEAIDRAHGGRGVVDGVVVHGRPFAADVLARYVRAGARPVSLDRECTRALGVWVAEADLTGRTELARHHPEKLGQVLIRLLGDGAPDATESRRRAARARRRPAPSLAAL
jgi:2-phospho-L-lactate transferase/gluconeogenesis factor (CofD/UPF0052 family)